MDMITISAKTLDEAITQALLELQTTSEHLHYEIVQKESAGILGIFGAKPCIIHARVMSETEEKNLKKSASDQEKKAKAVQKKPEKENTERVKKEEKETKAVKTEKQKIEKPKTEKPEKSDIDDKKEEKLVDIASHREYKKKESSSDNRFEKDYNDGKNDYKRQERRENGYRERSGRRNEKRYERRENPDKPEVPETVIREEKPRQPVKADPERVQTLAKEFLVNVFQAMGMEVSMETSVNLEEGELMVMMNGEDMGILIGKRGQTLDSLQYLVSLVVNRETEGYLRVKLDTENYRERRKETLETLAKNISYKVKRTRRPVSLEPMNPYERRIIHSTLQNDRYVVTRSEGEDPYRHVVISLKNDRYNGRRDRYIPKKGRERSFDRRRESQNNEEEQQNQQ